MVRVVQQELFRHEKLYELEKQTGLPMRIAWVGIFTACDSEGRFQWRPKKMKLDVLPYDDIDFDAILKELHEAGFLIRYKVKTQEYGWIPSWQKYQSCDGEPQSALPEYKPEAKVEPEDKQPAKPTKLSQAKRKAKPPTLVVGEEETALEAALGPQKLVDMWNELRGELPICRTLSKPRSEKARTQLKRYPDASHWEEAVRSLAASDFCVQKWRPCFDDFLNETKRIRAIEGRYDNIKRQEPKTFAQHRLAKNKDLFELVENM